ncbi:hypothetical protein E3N88_17392 [Mikania micrantha]|uniref:Uncharacterized protein n=1 Tax=Mikania micrantha TaxID=192012 RepID=A0A5N6NRS2_9ASTR|nr:hypothetical protein E3N88_17392 [Mikania micrantha]
MQNISHLMFKKFPNHQIHHFRSTIFSFEDLRLTSDERKLQICRRVILLSRKNNRRQSRERKSPRIALKSLSRFKNTPENPVNVFTDEEIEEENSYTEVDEAHNGTREKKQKAGKTMGKKKVTDGIGVENQVVVGKYPIIFNRCSPKQLFNAIRKLGSKQKHVVKQMGFGGLLSLQVEGVPQRMGFYVFDMFDEVNMEIRVPCGNIKVDEESLHNLLGVPKDGVDLLSTDANKVRTPSVTGWRKKYDKDYITPSDIVSRIIKNYDDVSLNFQLDFLVLFISTMVECYAHGKCKLDVLGYFSDDTDVGKINWCKYIISRLKDCKKGWERKATSPFKGGLTILTLMYVGSMKINGMNADVRVPPIKFWDLDRLKGREHIELASGRFGDGEIMKMAKLDWSTENEENTERLKVTFDDIGFEEQLKGIQRMLSNSFEEKREIEKRIQILYKKNKEDARLEVICSSYEEIYNSKPCLTDHVEEKELKHDNKKVFTGKGRKNKFDWDDRVMEICLEINKRRQVMVQSESENEVDDDHGEGAGHNVEMKGYDTCKKIKAGIGLKPNEMPSFSLGLTQEEIKKANTISGDETVEVLPDQKEANIFSCKEAEHGVKQHDMPSYSLGLTQEWAETKEDATPGEPADVTAKTFDLKGDETIEVLVEQKEATISNAKD